MRCLLFLLHLLGVVEESPLVQVLRTVFGLGIRAEHVLGLLLLLVQVDDWVRTSVRSVGLLHAHELLLVLQTLVRLRVLEVSVHVLVLLCSLRSGVLHLWIVLHVLLLIPDVGVRRLLRGVQSTPRCFLSHDCRRFLHRVLVNHWRETRWVRFANLWVLSLRNRHLVLLGLCHLLPHMRRIVVDGTWRQKKTFAILFLVVILLLAQGSSNYDLLVYDTWIAWIFLSSVNLSVWLDLISLFVKRLIIRTPHHIKIRSVLIFGLCCPLLYFTNSSLDALPDWAVFAISLPLCDISLISTCFGALGTNSWILLNFVDFSNNFAHIVRVGSRWSRWLLFDDTLTLALTCTLQTALG